MTLRTANRHHALSFVFHAVALASVLFLIKVPARAQSETVLYGFTGKPDGNIPQCQLTADAAGNLYGTTLYGGLGFGTVLRVGSSERS